MRLRKKHFAIPEMKNNEYVYFDGQKYKGRWNKVFNNDNPIYIEIGSGKGKFLAESAMRNPEINYIMIELDTNAFVYATRKIKEYKLKNVRAIPMNAEDILDYFQEDEVSRIYINFCNPWPKKRHQKRRLTYPKFLQKYKTVLKEDSQIYLKTDDRDFFEDSLDYFDMERFNFLLFTENMKEDEFPDNIVTEYERKWRDMGKYICFGVFEQIRFD